jgi:hypothetical protein
MVSITTEEYEALKASKATGGGGGGNRPETGFSEPEPDDRYEQYVRERYLIGGGLARWVVSLGGWVHLQIDFVPRAGKGSRAGFGGYFNRWRARYVPYFRSKEFAADLEACRVNGAKDAPGGE